MAYCDILDKVSVNTNEKNLHFVTRLAATTDHCSRTNSNSLVGHIMTYLKQKNYTNGHFVCLDIQLKNSY